MGRITLLEQQIVNQIAAGEVVERPAAVVKELVENAIDAGANQISVEIKDAGLKEIRVIDNGSGMSREDALLAVQRHATSKISTLQDLYRLETLGFRGEALPSIAAVSRFTLITRPPSEVSGTKLTVVGGITGPVAPVGCPPGTQVTVQDLFFNTPARRKFLKSTRTEAGIISDLIGRFALGYPEISFRYCSGKKVSFSTNGRNDILEVLGILYGNEAARQFIEVSYQADGIDLYGFISGPEHTRTSRYYQSFFVNRRLVHNTFLNHALENAFWGLIPKGHYPVAVLYLTVEPSSIDMNVHPTKREVRFSNPTLVAEVIRQGVRKVLVERRFPANTPSPETPVYFGIDDKADEHENRRWSFPRPLYEERRLFTPDGRGEDTAFPQAYNPLGFQSLQVIGQVQGLYIVAEREGEVYFIDQHAAHERVRYEAITERFRRKDSFQQNLFTPVVIKLTPEQRELYEEYRQFIGGLGYTLIEGDNDTFSLMSVPTELRDAPEQYLLNILDLLRDNAEIKNEPDAIYDRVVTLMACKSAVKAGDRLSQEEMKNLLVQLDNTSQPGNCPHGRPTFFKITNAELAKKFYRT